MELNKIYCMDNIEGMREYISDESIDLTVTSPPYYNAKEYSQYKAYDSYLEILKNTFTEVFRITKPSRMVVVNISPVIVPREKRSEQSHRMAIPFHFVSIMEKIGFEFLEDIIWKKPNASVKNRIGSFLQHKKPVAYKPNIVTEYILVFKKPAPFLIDKILKDEPIEDCEIENTNVWEIRPETKSKHPAPYPEELVKKVISYYSYKNDVVFDPYMGSGTTAKVSKDIGRNYIGFELLEKYCVDAEERVR